MAHNSRQIKLSEQTFFLVSYLVTIIMICCAAVSIVQLAKRIYSTWPGGYVIILVALISLERVLTRKITETLDQHQKWIYHLAEWITIAVSLKVLLYAIHGFDKLFEDLYALQANLLIFFEDEFLPVLILLVIAWWLTDSFINDLDELRIDQMDFHWDIGILENRRQEAREAMITRSLWLGMVMVLVAIFTRLDIIALFGPSPAYQAPVINVLVYFFLLLLLFSQSQYTLLRGRWTWHKVSIPSSFGQSWLRHSFAFLALLSVVAFLLPTAYTFEFLNLIRIVIIFVIQAVFFIVTFLMLPFGWLISLFQGKTSLEEPVQSPDLTGILPPESAAVVDPLVQLIQTILFWLILSAVIIFSIYTFIHQNSVIFNKAGSKSGLNWLINLFQLLKAWLSGNYKVIKDVVAEVRVRIQKITLSSAITPVLRYPNFRRLTPRQQVIFFYNRLLYRASLYGLVRKSSQTPTQFSTEMEVEFPDVELEIKGITSSFIEARYSLHSIRSESSLQAQKYWSRIVRSIERHKKFNN